MGNRSASTLVATLLSDPDDGVRAAAADVLGDLGGTEHLDALLGLLNDREARYAAARSFCLLADRDHLPHVLDLLAEESSPTQEATRALVRLMGTEAIPILLKNLETTKLRDEAVIELTTLITPENQEARAAMLRAGAVSDVDAVDALTKWLKATDSELLGELATVVRHADEPGPMLTVVSSGAAGYPNVLAAARGRLDELDEDDVEIRAAIASIQCAAGLGDGLVTLTALLPRLGRYQQWTLASALSHLESPPPEVVSVLLSLAASDHSLARAETARSLGRLDRPDATSAFLRLLEDPVPWIRRNTVSSLTSSRIGQNDTIANALLARLEDRSFHVRMEVVRVLGEAPKSIAVAPLLDTLANAISGEVRREVPAALAKHGIDDTAAAALRHAANEDPDPLVREAARRVLDGAAHDDG
jgi:HEAT repeat protein